MPIRKRITQTLAAIDSERTRLLNRLRELTELKTPNSPKQLGPWMRARGYPYKSLDQEHIKKALEKATDPKAIEILTIKLKLSPSGSAGKIKAMAARMYDGRVGYSYDYWGAHTGRFISKGAQMQNMSQKNDDVWEP